MKVDERDYLARRNLLQARAIVTVIVSAMIALIIQLVIDLYLSYKHVELPYIAWPVSFIGTLICAGILIIRYPVLSRADKFSQSVS